MVKVKSMGRTKTYRSRISELRNRAKVALVAAVVLCLLGSRTSTNSGVFEFVCIATALMLLLGAIVVFVNTSRTLRRDVRTYDKPAAESW